jgi:hypothetical protein
MTYTTFQRLAILLALFGACLPLLPSFFAGLVIGAAVVLVVALARVPR